MQWTVFTDPAQLKKIAAQTVDCLQDIVTTQPKETYPAYFPMILAGWDNRFRSHSLFLLLTSTQLTRPWRQFYIFLSGYILWGRFSVGHRWSAHPLLHNSFFDQNFVHTFSTIPPIFRVISENSLSYMFLDREPLWYYYSILFYTKTEISVCVLSSLRLLQLILVPD